MTTEHKYNIFFNIEERGRYKLLVDADGFICGAYTTYKAAKAAMPIVRRKLLKAFKERDGGKEVDNRPTNIVTSFVGHA